MTAEDMTIRGARLRKLLVGILGGMLATSAAVAAPISLTTIGSAYTQDFNTLANTGTTNSALPIGWALTETGGGTRDNEQYAAGTGSDNTGDTYSFGAAASTERAFGGLLSGTLIPVIGAEFINNTGTTITSLAVAYTGEQWRLGNLTRGIADRLDFQYSTNATSLATGTWTDVNALDFFSPTTTAGTTALDGNAAANRTALSSNIGGLNIANGATFWIRWTDFDIAPGADDGLAVDNFSLIAAIPEPGTLALLGLGLLGLIAVRRTQMKSSP